MIFTFLLDFVLHEIATCSQIAISVGRIAGSMCRLISMLLQFFLYLLLVQAAFARQRNGVRSRRKGRKSKRNELKKPIQSGLHKVEHILNRSAVNLRLTKKQIERERHSKAFVIRGLVSREECTMLMGSLTSAQTG